MQEKAAELFAMPGIGCAKMEKVDCAAIIGFYGRMKYFLISWKDLCAINCGKMAFYRLFARIFPFFSLIDHAMENV